MRKLREAVFQLVFVSATLVLAQALPQSTPITVDCSKGQSLNQTLAKLNLQTFYTVSVNGICTEFVQVVGFHNLVLKGLPGAALVQPVTGGGNKFNATLYVESSQSVEIEGFTVQGNSGTLPDINIGHGSTDIRLRLLDVQGGSGGIIVFENSQVSIAYVHVEDSGWVSLGIYDSSDVHVEHCLFEDTTPPGNVGIALGASHVTLYGTTIRNMYRGIDGSTDSLVDMGVFNTYYSTTGSTDVVITGVAGTNVNGVYLVGGSLHVDNARLVVNKGGVTLTDGATMYAASGSLAVTDSIGQGVEVMNNSHATLDGATVSLGSHAGLLAINNSSIDVANSNNLLSTIGGNAVDLFCDSDSKITGTANISGTPTATCTNLLSSETVALPYWI